MLRRLLADAPEDLRIDAELVAIELVTNSLEHALGPRSVTIAWAEDGLLHIAVLDGSPDAVLTPGHSRLGAHRGRGLTVVGAVARWGVDRGQTTKTVWATLTY
ncbi:ATP-binding protein [Pseudonocardia charpentierae]|uniref:ATP-binding protein n=1 Tax=Pseudonocardia charpentierae TaxID=3075545 RepID=A0ABU2NEK1_9PSEU|nr:ATP-binding protein [Pseudonocardia sp. DSM 45834]MDT0352387.1 ATP-binding protein [Pseudonocardia sp. DSM 45834]